MRATDNLAHRVALQFMVAMEHPSEEARRDYLHDHPQADPKNHVVKKPEDHGGGHSEHSEEKKSLKDRWKSLSSKAQSFFKSAPKAVKDFVTDPEHRRKSLLQAHGTVMKAPSKFVSNLVETAKHEVKEFKEAGEGIAAVIKGGKMNDHQKKAFKTVATHVALTVAATALTVSGGPLAAAGAFGKSMVKHVAMKSVSRALGHVHVFQEIEHIGHGLHHIIDKLAAEEKEGNDEKLVKLVMAAVAKELEELNEDDIQKALEHASSGDEEESKTAGLAYIVATEFKLSKGKTIGELIEQLEDKKRIVEGFRTGQARTLWRKLEDEFQQAKRSYGHGAEHVKRVIDEDIVGGLRSMGYDDMKKAEAAMYVVTDGYNMEGADEEGQETITNPYNDVLRAWNELYGAWDKMWNEVVDDLSAPFMKDLTAATSKQVAATIKPDLMKLMSDPLVPAIDKVISKLQGLANTTQGGETNILPKGAELIVEARKGKWFDEMVKGAHLVVLEDAKIGGPIRLQFKGWAEGSMGMTLESQDPSGKYIIQGNMGRAIKVTRVR